MLAEHTLDRSEVGDAARIGERISRYFIERRKTDLTDQVIDVRLTES